MNSINLNGEKLSALDAISYSLYRGAQLPLIRPHKQLQSDHTPATYVPPAVSPPTDQDILLEDQVIPCPFRDMYRISDALKYSSSTANLAAQIKRENLSPRGVDDLLINHVIKNGGIGVQNLIASNVEAGALENYEEMDEAYYGVTAEDDYGIDEGGNEWSEGSFSGGSGEEPKDSSAADLQMQVFINGSGSSAGDDCGTPGAASTPNSMIDRHYWNEAETNLLVELYVKNLNRFKERKHTGIAIWEEIATEIRNRLSSTVTGDQCHSKLRNMKRTYLRTGRVQPASEMKSSDNGRGLNCNNNNNNNNINNGQPRKQSRDDGTTPAALVEIFAQQAAEDEAMRKKMVEQSGSGGLMTSLASLPTMAIKPEVNANITTSSTLKSLMPPTMVHSAPLASKFALPSLPSKFPPPSVPSVALMDKPLMPVRCQPRDSGVQTDQSACGKGMSLFAWTQTDPTPTTSSFGGSALQQLQLAAALTVSGAQQQQTLGVTGNEFLSGSRKRKAFSSSSMGVAAATSVTVADQTSPSTAQGTRASAAGAGCFCGGVNAESLQELLEHLRAESDASKRARIEASRKAERRHEDLVENLRNLVNAVQALARVSAINTNNNNDVNIDSINEELE